MAVNSGEQYWEHEECGEVAGFSTKEFPEKPCWKMASEVNSFRSAFNICDDCIVFVTQNGYSVLSEKEIRSIGNRLVCCKFFFS